MIATLMSAQDTELGKWQIGLQYGQGVSDWISEPSGTYGINYQFTPRFELFVSGEYGYFRRENVYASVETGGLQISVMYRLPKK